MAGSRVFADDALAGRVALVTGGGTNLGTHELARAWGGDGVSVLAVAIGRFATESLRKYPGELWRTAAATIPVQRLGDVEEYGWLVALLASPLGGTLSGSVVTIDGALDNWTGSWPPAGLASDGEVPTEIRRPVP